MISTNGATDSVATPVSPGVSDETEDTLTPDEQQAWRAFVDGTHALLATLDKALVGDADLSLGEYLILTVLAENRCLRMSDLSTGGLASRSTVSRQVSRLVEIGDIERLNDSTDARNRLVCITGRGREHLNSASVDHTRRVRRHLFDHVSADQLDDLGALFSRVREGLES